MYIPITYSFLRPKEKNLGWVFLAGLQTEGKTAITTGRYFELYEKGGRGREEESGRDRHIQGAVALLAEMAYWSSIQVRRRYIGL